VPKLLFPAAVAIAPDIAVPPRVNWALRKFVSEPTVMVTNTIILLAELVGVIIAVSPVTAEKLLFTDALNPVVNVVLTTCKTDPVGNVAFGMVCVPVSVEAATDAISPEATCVKAMFVP
jgi:hypothetical protein